MATLAYLKHLYLNFSDEALCEMLSTLKAPNVTHITINYLKYYNPSSLRKDMQDLFRSLKHFTVLDAWSIPNWEDSSWLHEI